MSAYQRFEISCNGVGCYRFLTFPGNKAYARSQASREGWLTGQPTGEDYCPVCRLPVEDARAASEQALAYALAASEVSGTGNNPNEEDR